MNMKRGWEWDLDEFTVNQFGHPYQGNNYFTAGRANGLSYWESAALTAFGSGTWEYFGETNQASLNDFINTTLGGIALGEMFHRAAWLVRDTHKTGKARLWSEIGAMAIDPVTGIQPVPLRGRVERDRQAAGHGAVAARAPSRRPASLARTTIPTTRRAHRSAPGGGSAVRQHRGRPQPDSRTTRSSCGWR